MSERPVLVCDIETYHGFFLIAFKRLSDGKVRTFELSDRSTFDPSVVRSIMMKHRIVTYNGQGYDVPLIFYALDLLENPTVAWTDDQSGAAQSRLMEQPEINRKLKAASDHIITKGVKYWEIEGVLGIAVPRRLDHVDLMEPQPNAWASLKTLQGRMHGKKMQDLPIEPDATLTHADMDGLTTYCINDLDATHNLFDKLQDALELREYLSDEYGFNFRCKSDAQCGETILKKRVEQLRGERVEKDTTFASSFPYRVPPYMTFERPELQDLLQRLRTTDFFVMGDGKVDLPTWLAEKEITIGGSTYAMGIGGLHSTEKNRAVYADDNFALIDFDVASYYPAIILNSGLYPKALGPAFLEVYRKIRDERVEAKRRAKEIEKVDLPAVDLTTEEGRARHDALMAELSRCKAADKGLKIALNGVFGKLGSRYSVLYAPHLMIAVTLTGQLALLMLIERAEAAGISVVSANTDGLVFRCPRDREADLYAITKQWESDTGFELEDTRYRALYSANVNSYVAVKEDGKAKMKGPLANPWREGDVRGQLMKNPQMLVVSDAVVDLLTKGIPIEETIRGAKDVRDFITVVNVKGGGVWGGQEITSVEGTEYLGKVVRYYWAKGGSPIFYKTPDPRTGNFKKVSKTDGCRPLMELPDDNALPDDIDYDAYIEAAQEILKDIGAEHRPPPTKPLRIYKWSAWAWFAVAAA